MNCPKCGGRTRVKSWGKGVTGKWRTRACLQCAHRFSTFEPEGGEESVSLTLYAPEPAALTETDRPQRLGYNSSRQPAAVPDPDELRPCPPPKFAGPWHERQYQEWLQGLMAQVQRG